MSNHPNMRVKARGGKIREDAALSDDNRGELEVLSAARNPAIQFGGAFDVGEEPGPPGNLAGGIALYDVEYALLTLTLRRDAAFRTAIITVTGVDNSQTYTATINGVDHDYVSDADATEAEILTGIAAAIEAGAQPVSASVVGTTVVVVGDPSANPGGGYTIEVSATGSGELSLEGTDASAVTAKVWAKLKGIEGDTDAYHDLEGYEVTASNNLVTRLDVSGFVYGYVEPTSVDGRVVVGLSPCVVTEQEAEQWPS